MRKILKKIQNCFSLFLVETSLYAGKWFLKPYFSKSEKYKIIITGDPVRYGSITLAINDICNNNIDGAFAECGVYIGYTSRYIHNLAPEKNFYLFDTFEGFDKRDMNKNENDNRFKDTSVASVLKYISSDKNIIIKKGYFPMSSRGLENETFSFVMLDFDKYKPTLEGLNFFYPRIKQGGYLFVHDYNSPESDWACFTALNEFLKDKPERPICIPDVGGTALFRKL